MVWDYGNIDWLAILVCVVIGQVFLTIWFLVLFGDPWAKAFGVADKKQHAKEIPGYTYAIGALCVLMLSVGLAVLQQAFAVDSAAGGLQLGLVVALHFCIATALPGYAFLKRWPAFFMAIGSQTALILILSLVLALWP